MADNEFPSTLESAPEHVASVTRLSEEKYFGPIDASPIRVEETKPEDVVNHPKHYGSHPSGVECIRITEHMSFNPGNAIKYLWRADDKGTQEKDLRKARWYVGRELLRLGYCTQEQFEAMCELDQQEQAS